MMHRYLMLWRGRGLLSSALPTSGTPADQPERKTDSPNLDATLFPSVMRSRQETGLH